MLDQEVWAQVLDKMTWAPMRDAQPLMAQIATQLAKAQQTAAALAAAQPPADGVATTQ